ncbi:MAG: HAMP domain-containing histidine kinase [Clostridia bacterium]|nr:MAG: HAMP domain-containing histidine kinase [Clostridia bacterium]
MGLRTRLTLYYTGVLALTLLVFGLVTYLVMGRMLLLEADRAITAKADEVIRSVTVMHMPMMRFQRIILPNVDAFSSPGTYLQVVDLEGSIVGRSENLGLQDLPFSQDTIQRTTAGSGYYETVEVQGEKLRLYNRPLAVRDQVLGVLQVGRSLRPMTSALAYLRLVLLAGSFLALVLAATLGYQLARAALRPIIHLTRVAAAIGAGPDLARRVPDGGPADEVGQLAATFNSMLERLEAAYRNLEEAYAAERRFVADASHELRTPLTTIRGNVELLQRMGQGDAAILADMADEAERMTRLVNELLTLARADAGRHLRKEPVDLGKMAADVARQAPHLGKSRFTASLAGLNEAVVQGDPDYLKQLLLILLENAFKYTPAEGAVTLEAGESEGYWGLAVKDTGHGISEKDLPHIFERFYRADPARGRGGTGLGLAIAKWIAEEHLGRIEVSSRLGEGSTFTVWLPRGVPPSLEEEVI